MNEEQKSKTRKRPVRSGYLFPSYDFGVARKIAENVERNGAGILSEETLAITLGASAKSSGFRLRALAARQFGLLTKQGDTLKTTPLAKAIIKPTNESERDRAIVESFLNIPLFKVIATRFKGQPLPQGEAFRNILEREFKIQSNRVGEAERIFRDSAREAGLLQTSGNNTYLVTQTLNQPVYPSPSIESQKYQEPIPIPKAQQDLSSVSMGDSFTISEYDLDELEDEDFDEIWKALGKVLRVRGKKRQMIQKQEEPPNIEREDEVKE